MTMTGTPPDLRAAIARDLKPTRPLARPSRRSLIVLPMAIAILVGIPLLHQFRPDMEWLGLTRSWVLSILQSLAGVGLVALALRESVPGRAVAGTRVAVAIGLGLLIPAAVLAVTAVPGVIVGSSEGHWWMDSYLCFRTSALAAAPALFLSAALAARAYPLRPAIAGALYGLGSGLIADAGLRLYCDYSEASHVLFAHDGAVAASMFAGMGMAVILARGRR